MKITTRLLIAGACVVLTVVAHGRVGTYSKGAWRCLQTGESQRKVDRDSVAEEPVSANPKEREVRKAKNTRYNTAGPILPLSDRKTRKSSLSKHGLLLTSFLPQRVRLS